MHLIFVDLDGVLFDFMAGAAALVGKPSPTTMECRQTPCRINYNTSEAFDCPTLWDDIAAAGPDFWINLPPTPWAHELLTFLRSHGEVMFLSHPGTDAFSHHAASGKLQALRRTFDVRTNEVIITTQKHRLAARGRWLVDDHDVNCMAWAENEGAALTIPQPWNRLWMDTPRDVMTDVRNGFDAALLRG